MANEVARATRPDRPDDWNRQETIEDTVVLWLAWVYRDAANRRLTATANGGRPTMSDNIQGADDGDPS